MEKKTFTNGSFVIHGINHLTRQRISAWFDAEGKPIDAEYMPSGRAVSQCHKNVWKSLESVGKAWRI